MNKYQSLCDAQISGQFQLYGFSFCQHGSNKFTEVQYIVFSVQHFVISEVISHKKKERKKKGGCILVTTFN